ncbi:MAG: hypothetical protein ACRDP9_15180 [Kribbellaceae bacterium]
MQHEYSEGYAVALIRLAGKRDDLIRSLQRDADAIRAMEGVSRTYASWLAGYSAGCTRLLGEGA